MVRVGNNMQSLNRKEVMYMRTEFCKQNKITQRYYRQRHAFIVDFRTLEEYSLDFYKKTNQKDLAKLKEKAFVNSQTLERLFYEELLDYINKHLSFKERKAFKLLIHDGLKQKTVAKLLQVNPRTIRRYLTKIKRIIRKYQK